MVAVFLLSLSTVANAAERTATTKSVRGAVISGGAVYWLDERAAIWQFDVATGTKKPIFVAPSGRITDFEVDGGTLAVRFSPAGDSELGLHVLVAVDTATGVTRELVNGTHSMTPVGCEGGIEGVHVTSAGEVVVASYSITPLPGATCDATGTLAETVAYRKDGTSRVLRSEVGPPKSAADDGGEAWFWFIASSTPLDVEGEMRLMGSADGSNYVLDDLASGVSTRLRIGRGLANDSASMQLLSNGAVFAYAGGRDPLLFPTPKIRGTSVVLRRKGASRSFAACGDAIVEAYAKQRRSTGPRPRMPGLIPDALKNQRLSIYNLKGKLVRNLRGRVRDNSELIGCDAKHALFSWKRPDGNRTGAAPPSGAIDIGGDGRSTGAGVSTVGKRKHGPAQRLFVVPLT